MPKRGRASRRAVNDFPADGADRNQRAGNNRIAREQSPLFRGPGGEDLLELLAPENHKQQGGGEPTDGSI
jgi:hypothetical protein